MEEDNHAMDQTDGKIVENQTLRDHNRKNEGSVDVNIKSHPEIGAVPRMNEYPMDSAPRGFAMIINNGLFKPESGFNPRKGSDKDVENLTDLFQFLGLRVFSMQDLSKGQILKTIDGFRTLFEKNTVSMCIICIMSPMVPVVIL
jgi:hypothetical protein